ncbi:MAG TPA: GntR family transcriptional regulator [Xanthobacteraceae bacterium]|jgi:DNA-binding GntR family transcriptional regulator|nr:GntR family transcriptional regulator [Xanthobacteraceae bacterium]
MSARAKTRTAPPKAASALVAEFDGEATAAEPRSLSDVAYEAIKHRITTCAFKPGEVINEAGLSVALGIGRTPVHQAIGRLMHEGMVDIIPRKGVIVRPVSLDESLEIIEVRLLNEGYCARLAADRADRDEIAHMTDVLARAGQWIATRNSEQLMRLDREFHIVLARSSKNAILAEYLSRLHDRSLRFWFISLTAPGHHESVQAQHEDILDAIRRRDADGAESAMRSHIEAFRNNLTHRV